MTTHEQYVKHDFGAPLIVLSQQLIRSTKVFFMISLNLIKFKIEIIKLIGIDFCLIPNVINTSNNAIIKLIQIFEIN